MPGATSLARGLSLRSNFGSLRNTGAGALGTLYFALSRGRPGYGGVEPTIGTGGYARVAKTNDDTIFGTISSTTTTITNNGTSGAIIWPVIGAGGWSVITPLDFWAVYDAATAGNLWYYGPLTMPITATNSGDTPRIPSGALIISLPE
jgi:hypothetical protein